MKTVPFMIAIIGIILLAGGGSTYLVKSSSTAVCEACGMEIAKEDVSTIKVISQPSGETHWACCPVCAMITAMYYENATLQAHCFSCGENITVEFDSGNISLVSPSGETHNVTMIFGMTCMKNKFVCSNECANSVRMEYDWASGLPAKTMSQTFDIAGSKYAQFTVGYKPIQVPAITYGLLFSGIALLIVAPLEWSFVEKKGTAKESKDA